MTATDTYLLLRAFCDELSRCGLREACTSPGSRSAPVVLSLVREPRIRCWSHVDERCAAFFALGAAKASGRPVALSCTSGTAAANFAPAVIEAYQARVPLIVLTADRPAELRDVGAGQTIDQLKLYGTAVKWFVEADLSEATAERLRWIRQLACRAYWTSISDRPGPVHINLPLREPLVLDGPLPSSDPVPGRPDGRPWVRPQMAGQQRAIANEAPSARALPARTVIVAGRYEGTGSLPAAVAALAERCGYPLLADPLSGARRGRAVVGRYDLLLRFEAFTASVDPELILRVGDLPTSKPLRAWLAGLEDVEQISLDPEAAWQDPSAAVSGFDPGDPLAAIAAMDRGAGSPDPIWLARWRAADAAADEAIATIRDGTLSEPLVAARLTEWLPPEATLFVASSMPIRDVEEFAAVGDGLPRVMSNRGANGIDGTVSTAFGLAAASDGPVVLLIGDVTLAHDIGGLLSARRLSLSLTIVLLNNDGGGIFHFLPVSGEGAAFEEHVATPHGLDFAHAAALYGCDYERIESEERLEPALSDSIRSAQTRILEVRTDRRENLALHRRISETVGEALASTVGG